MMRVEYRLTAQLVPVNINHWVGHLPALGISLARIEKSLFVNRAPNTEIEVNHNVSQEMSSKIGGFLGMGKTSSHSFVSLEKDVFTVGEKINVMIRCDNQACNKRVESFKLKLLRNI